ncbi:MAG: 50S ribosomal protein L38e [Candidatus Bathyarchaeia archaeon]|nr:50S ribosomal protein L38e [Candidatus Bathyarchaeota archaeon]
MPTEIFDVERFIELSEKAEYCIIKRLKDIVKLKLRTPRMLYTLKVDPAKAEEIIRQIKCEVREV